MAFKNEKMKKRKRKKWFGWLPDMRLPDPDHGWGVGGWEVPYSNAKFVNEKEWQVGWGWSGGEAASALSFSFGSRLGKDDGGHDSGSPRHEAPKNR
jgi:hypothetical protein